VATERHFAAVPNCVMQSALIKCFNHTASVVNKDLTFKAKAKDSKFVLEDTPRPRTKTKDTNTAYSLYRIP